MGIVNVTPDSFSDGGRFFRDGTTAADAVVSTCREWVRAGVAVLDVGGESTRPGAAPVATELELERVLPPIQALRKDPVAGTVPISVDTRHAAVADAALEAGASIVNDVSGLADPGMARVVAKHGAGVVVGHLRGLPSTMMEKVEFEDLVGEVVAELRASLGRLWAAGVEASQVVVDPCVGFGKDAEQSAALALSARRIQGDLGQPVLIGVSRKRFLGRLTGRDVPDRGGVSVVAGILALEAGASLVRVHDVQETLDAVAVREGLRRAALRHGLG